MRKFSEWATDEKGMVSGLFVVAAGFGLMGIGAYVLSGLLIFIRHHPRICIAVVAFSAVYWGYLRWVDAVQRPGRRKRDPNVCPKCGRAYWKDVGRAADETAQIVPQSPQAPQ